MASPGDLASAADPRGTLMESEALSDLTDAVAKAEVHIDFELDVPGDLRVLQHALAKLKGVALLFALEAKRRGTGCRHGPQRFDGGIRWLWVNRK